MHTLLHCVYATESGPGRTQVTTPARSPRSAAGYRAHSRCAIAYDAVCADSRQLIALSHERGIIGERRYTVHCVRWGRAELVRRREPWQASLVRGVGLCGNGLSADQWLPHINSRMSDTWPVDLRIY